MRLINDQMVELYDRVPLNSRVVMYPTSVTWRLQRERDCRQYVAQQCVRGGIDG